MLLELSEILACPVCGPPQVMVAVVYEAAGHRVIRGFLGCPACDSRFPIEQGSVHLVSEDSGEPPVAPPSVPIPGPDETAMLLGAVLGLAGGSGHLLLSPGLAAVADAVARSAEKWEVVSLLAAPTEWETPPGNVSRIVVPSGAAPPVLGGRCGAAALAGDPGPVRISEYASALTPPGRLAIIAPGSGAVESMRTAGLEVIASDERVAVASRRS
jgi:uncharacterized protein YbaR (Trm112 family)